MPAALLARVLHAGILAAAIAPQRTGVLRVGSASLRTGILHTGVLRAEAVALRILLRWLFLWLLQSRLRLHRVFLQLLHLCPRLRSHHLLR